MDNIFVEPVDTVNKKVVNKEHWYIHRSVLVSHSKEDEIKHYVHEGIEVADPED